MVSIYKKILAFALLFGSSVFAREIPQANIVSLDSDVRVFHTKRGFSVLENGKIYVVRSENLDKELRGLTNKEIDLLLGNKAIVTIDGKKAEFTRIPETFANNIVSHSDSVESIKESISEDILSQLPSQNHIKVIKYNNGDFGLKFKVNMIGGGVFGGMCGAWMGKFIVHAAFQTVMVVGTGVACVVLTPMVALPLAASVEATCMPMVEATSIAVGMAGAIGGAVSTGPV